jgi:hypothetical protein
MSEYQLVRWEIEKSQSYNAKLHAQNLELTQRLGL